MAKGIALAIGLNSVDPNHYAGWSGPLNACEADAEDMTLISKAKGFKTVMLLTDEAKRDQVIDEIERAATQLSTGDIFMLSYSGHGGQLPDANNDEDDGQDETWCLYDGELVDDEIYTKLGKFARGVRILVLSDSCHSGTVTKVAYYRAAGKIIDDIGGSSPRVYRAMPPKIARETYRQNKEFYDPILRDSKLREGRSALKASTMLISGCQDNQLSADGTFNGLFTGTLLQVWNNGGFTGGYRAFHKAIVRQMPPDQTPNYFWAGERDAAFEKEIPFTL